MISAVSNVTIPQKYNKALSFGTLEREVYKNNQKKEIKYRNNTTLFRQDLNWRRVTNYIISDEKPKKIYCYACSDGSEPYSVAIMLISKLGWKGAQKYFPIIARDIDKFAVNRAKSGFINLTDIDVIGMMKKQNNPLTDFFIYKKKTAFEDNYSTYKVSDRLRACVNFEKGNLLDDAKNLNYDNAVIFFRNVWPYLSKSERRNLMTDFSERFKENTTLVVGAYDENPEGENFIVPNFEYEMEKYDLHSMGQKIYKKYKINGFKDFIKVLWHRMKI